MDRGVSNSDFSLNTGDYQASQEKIDYHHIDQGFNRRKILVRQEHNQSKPFQIEVITIMVNKENLKARIGKCFRIDEKEDKKINDNQDKKIKSLDNMRQEGMTVMPNPAIMQD